METEWGVVVHDIFFIHVQTFGTVVEMRFDKYSRTDGVFSQVVARRIGTTDKVNNTHQLDRHGNYCSNRLTCIVALCPISTVRTHSALRP